MDIEQLKQENKRLVLENLSLNEELTECNVILVSMQKVRDHLNGKCTELGEALTEAMEELACARSALEIVFDALRDGNVVCEFAPAREAGEFDD